MFDVGFSELLVIALIGLIVLGPKRLPEAARTAGRWMAKVRNFVTDVKSDFDREMRNAEIMELQRLKQELDETRRAVEDSSNRLVNEIGQMSSLNDEKKPLPPVADVASVSSPEPIAPTSTARKSKKAPTAKQKNGRTNAKRKPERTGRA